MIQSVVQNLFPRWSDVNIANELEQYRVEKLRELIESNKKTHKN